jgi:hypothetical protein
MGIWLSGTVFISVVATQNFYTIDRLLASSPNVTFSDAASSIQHPPLRELLRYLSSELNRLYFQYWNLAQLAVGIAALLLVGRIPGGKRAAWGIASMLFVVLFLMVAVTPYIISTGRDLDFVPRDPPPPELQKFGLLHATYSSLTLINLILGGVVTFWIQRESSSAGPGRAG